MSYYHVEWVSRAACEEGKTGKQRVKRFLDKPIWETQWSDDEPFNPNFTKVKIIFRHMFPSICLKLTMGTRLSTD